ncbi:hypothetical protein TNCT_372911 [Trichonephila clavata]|uniref:Uncharacterized protein n=1 Tax=Trichonephila clavata TaxID=2740835 RepID=A0A8X6KCD0_TRICU|nr:hypothetical protein TNCT_372911 [Trichonephila clavata]
MKDKTAAKAKSLSSERPSRKKRRISISKFREQIRPYKVRLGKNSSTPAFTSEEERSFTIEQIHRSPNQRSASVEVLSGDSTESL